VRDILPDPVSCLITGITPQDADKKGILEPEFIARINAEFSVPGTCGVGYNSLRFDDEVTRHTLYRNFFDPYAREWRDGNSRWDIIDLSRMTYALRPEGIEWPRHEDGRASFKLEQLTAANGIGHESAHDALSDVRATIAWARLLKEKQSRLFGWLYRLRDKRQAETQLDLIHRAPVLHTSGMYPPDIGCTTLVIPLVKESKNKNGVLVYDIRHDPEQFMALDEEGLRERLFTKKDDLPAGVERLPVKSVKINKCPALAPLKTLDEVAAERIAIDLDTCHKNREKVLADEAFIRRIARAYTRREFGETQDVEIALYDGFIDNKDRSISDKIRQSKPEELAATEFKFKDKRLPELLFRYRARNWPDTLTNEEAQRWAESGMHRLQHSDEHPGRDLAEYQQRIGELRVERDGDDAAQRVLDSMEEWGRACAEEFGI
jgi:exodeoxyribonuclease-1